jgi:hypothetical protein
VWTALTSRFFVLAAFFVAAAVAAFVRIEVAALFLAALLVALASRLLSFLRIAWWRLMCTALLTGASAGVTLLHTLIALTIVCHICSSPL